MSQDSALYRFVRGHIFLGFPESFKFEIAPKHGYAPLGNMVTSILAWTIAEDF